MMRTLEIYIDRIEVEGVEGLHAGDLKKAVEKHLESHFSNPSHTSFENPQTVSRLRGGSIQVQNGMSTQQFGSRVANRVIQSLPTGDKHKT